MSSPEAVTSKPYTEQDFIRGNPEMLLQATENPRILIVWPHGDETLGPRVGHHIYSKRLELLKHVDYICGNPVAARQSPAVRDTSDFIEPLEKGATGTDLNRSFRPGRTPTSYEERRAEMILSQIENGCYDYVLDLHTSLSDLGRCFLMSESYIDNPRARRIIEASPIRNIVVLPERVLDPKNPGQTVPLVTDGLIGNVPHSISLEYSRPLALEIGVRETMLTIDGLVAAAPRFKGLERNFYHVTTTIPQDANLEGATNFKWCDAGFIPVLYGEDSYRGDKTKFYSGFAATSVTTTII